MKIVLLHGDNTLKVNERAKSISSGVRKKGWKVEHVDKNTDIAHLFMSTSLFPESKLIVVDGVHNLSVTNVKFLSENIEKLDGSMLIIHNGIAPKTTLKPISKFITEEKFELPKIIFKFLDSIYPGNAKLSLSLFHALLESEAKELIFSLMSSHLRDLLWAKKDFESLPYPDWRSKKIVSQSNKFSDKQLTELISGLSNADIESKNGGQNLLTSLDIILVKMLS